MAAVWLETFLRLLPFLEIMLLAAAASNPFSSSKWVRLVFIVGYYPEQLTRESGKSGLWLWTLISIHVSSTHFWSRVNSQIITIPILKSRDFKHFREKSELRTVLKRVFEHMPSKFWCNMRLQLHILPKKNEGAVTLDKSSCIFSGITIHEMTTEMTENLHSLHLCRYYNKYT